MANFVGTWQIQKSDNFETYMEAIGVTEDNRKKALAVLGDDSKMSYSIANDGDSWEFKVWTKAGEKVIKFTLGTKFDTMTLDEREISTTFTLDGSKLVEVQEGNGFKSTNIRTVDGDTMTMVMDGNGTTCKRFYKKV